MEKLRFSSALVLAFIACASFAQTAPTPPAVAPMPPVPPMNDNNENIIIHKNGDSKEKLTIVIDGDNVTINGKPAKDFKNGDVQIINGNDMVMPAFPPMPPQGGVKAFTRNFNMRSNDAMLGIIPADADDGAKIDEVTTGSAADKAGLKKGDVITKINDTKIDGADDVYDAIGKYKPNDKVTITYMRDKKEGTATATLDKSKARTFVGNNNDNGAFDMLRNNRNFSFNWNDNKPRLGLRVQDTENGQGVTVMDINDDDSPAAKARLKEKDVITEVNGKAVQSVKDIKDQLQDVKPGDDVKLQYKRNGSLQSATVHIPKPLQTSDL